MADNVHPVLERVARAIHEGLGECWAYSNYSGDEWNEASTRKMLDNDARAAIQALLEPDEGMLRTVVSWPAVWEWPGTPVQQAAYEADKLYARSMFTDMLRPLIGEGE